MLFFPAWSQKNADVIDLLIDCYEFLYNPEAIAETSETNEVADFTCIRPPANFYDDFHDFRIGFDLLRTTEVFSFSFSDSVAAPLHIPLVITSGFNIRRSNGKIHQGIDFELSIGDTVYSTFCGEVRIETFDTNGYGNVVVVRNYNMSETLYGHLDKNLVRNSQKVTVGQAIGIGGNTGVSTGPHLHYEIRSSGYSFNPVSNGMFLTKYKVSFK
jgi:murein DD-endopeptidase MepM/ murein hydrolase activator NlpD